MLWVYLFMTIQEALDEIRSRNKWYAIVDNDNNPVPQSNLFVTAQRIEQGDAKESTMRKFFDYFGYDLEISKKVVKR